MSERWPYRRIATEEAFSVPEVYEALRDWAATADPAEPDQDFWDFVFTQDLDEPKYWPILEAAEALGAPIYIHPRSPAAPMAAAFEKYGLATGIWAFQAETGLHGLRLICSGVFDRFPRLRIVLGHLGEGLPYWLYRLDYMHPVRSSYHTRPSLSLTPSEYVKRNFAITTSGMNWAPVLRFRIEAVGAGNIMFAIDYPYQTTEAAVRFPDEAEISDEDKRKIYHQNAERIFGIAPAGGVGSRRGAGVGGTDERGGKE